MTALDRVLICQTRKLRHRRLDPLALATWLGVGGGEANENLVPDPSLCNHGVTSHLSCSPFPRAVKLSFWVYVFFSCWPLFSSLRKRSREVKMWGTLNI